MHIFLWGGGGCRARAVGCGWVAGEAGLTRQDFSGDRLVGRGKKEEAHHPSWDGGLKSLPNFSRFSGHCHETDSVQTDSESRIRRDDGDR